MKMNIYDYTIAEYYLPAIINGDYSGLGKVEEKTITKFISRLSKQHGNGRFDIGENEEPRFTKDEISGLLGMCVDAQYYVPIEKTLREYAEEAAEDGYLIAVYQYGRRLTYDIREMEEEFLDVDAGHSGFYTPNKVKYKGKSYTFMFHNTYKLPYKY